MFSSNNPRRFKHHSQRTDGSSPMVDGSLVSDPIILLNEWTKHFAERGKSQLSTQQDHPAQYLLPLHELEASSYHENDNIR